MIAIGEFWLCVVGQGRCIVMMYVLFSRYDPTTRPWYHAAKTHSGKLVFSVPYLDNGGAGVVVTTSRTISSDSMVSNCIQ